MKIDYPTTEDLPALRRLWQNTFGDSDAYLDVFFSIAYAPQRCLCLRTNAQIVAAAYWLDCEIGGKKAAYIYAVATDEGHRGRGYCHALMAQIHSLLLSQDYCICLLVPADARLRHMYRGMGYADFGGVQEFTCQAASPAEALRPVEQQEFAALRRKYLPENALIQEGCTLELLSRLADFHAGDDCLLTVSREGNRILEFLGNTEKLPGILFSLHMQSASVRIPGNMPFAMYHSLKEAKTPTYFSFALD